MIQGVAWHYLGILYFLAHPKRDLGNNIVSILLTLCTHYRLLAVPKYVNGFEEAMT